MRHVARYVYVMIKTIRHKGLKRLFEDDDPRGVNPNTSRDCGIFWRRFTPRPKLLIWTCRGFACIRSKGEMRGLWAVTVRSNWRVIFRFDGDAEDVDYVDYH
jgi:toxin HigB-1